jgi:hypothetical protein
MKKIVSISISVVILGSVCFSAFYIVYKGATSSTSNVQLLREYIQEEPSVVVAYEEDISQIPPCESLREIITSNSLVDYLKAQNMESSFQAREGLAREARIEGYRGLENQNELLKIYLIGKLEDVSEKIDAGIANFTNCGSVRNSVN